MSVVIDYNCIEITQQNWLCNFNDTLLFYTHVDAHDVPYPIECLKLIENKIGWFVIRLKNSRFYILTIKVVFKYVWRVPQLITNSKFENKNINSIIFNYISVWLLLYWTQEFAFLNFNYESWFWVRSVFRIYWITNFFEKWSVISQYYQKYRNQSLSISFCPFTFTTSIHHVVLLWLFCVGKLLKSLDLINKSKL